LLIGQKKEDPSIIDDLLDIEKYPSKPEYTMCSEVKIYNKNSNKKKEKKITKSFCFWKLFKLFLFYNFDPASDRRK